MYARIVAALLAVVGGFALAGIAIYRDEQINSLWIITAAVCVYVLGYRFYAKWIETRVYVVDKTRATPAERLNNGRDYIPTHRWVLFGHHFAAIAGAGPLVGPTLAMQFGYLPGTLWIIVGSVIGGCVQDMTILFLSTRRDGRSLGKIARDELGRVGGTAATLGTVMIVVIVIAVLGLVVVNAMKHSPWATFTVFATIPIAILVGFYMRTIRPGKVLEGSLIGVALLILAVVGGGWIDHHEGLRNAFNWQGTALAGFVITYGWIAAILPVWVLLAPRDYISTFLKISVVVLLAVAILIMHPVIKMPALTQFVDGTGPLFSGKVFPFAFITIACGALSGFHALVSSGTTPKMVANEGDIRLAGYGSMVIESFVAIMAVIAATLLDPGVYFAINSGTGVVGATAEAAVQTISGWGYPVTVEQMQQLATDVGETSLFARTGGAPSLAVGMASIFGTAFGKGPDRHLVPLRHHVRGRVHPDDGGCRHACLPLPRAGRAGPAVCAAGPHLLVSLGAGLQHAGRGHVGLLPLRGRGGSERRHQHPVAVVRHRQPDAGGDCAVGGDGRDDQEWKTQVRLGHGHSAGMDRGGDDHRRLPEDIQHRSEAGLLRRRQ